MYLPASVDHASSPAPAGVARAAEKRDVVHFICWMQDGWFVEGEDGEVGPFDDLREAEAFCFGQQQH
jgi:hypothetical protein